MVQSSTEIVNLAMSYLGEKPISSFSERPRGLDCGLIYDTKRDALIRGFPWLFAMRRLIPNLLEDAPIFEYDYQFQLPADFLRIWALYSDAHGTRYTGRWHPETDASGWLLLANVDVLYIKYLARITTVGLYPDSFVTVLARSLAADLAVPIGKGLKIATAQYQILQRELLTAYTQDAMDDGEFQDEQGANVATSWAFAGRY